MIRDVDRLQGRRVSTLAFYLFSDKQLKIVYKMWLGNKVISFGKSPSLIFWLSDISSQTFYIASEERKALLEAKMLAVRPGRPRAQDYGRRLYVDLVWGVFFRSERSDLDAHAKRNIN